MSIQQPPLKVARTTTVANLSTSARFPVERSSAATPPPQTRPPQAAVPVVIEPPVRDTTGLPKVSKEQTPLRASLEALARNSGPGSRAAPVRLAPRRPIHTGGINDPPEGVGAGQPPPGGIKMR
jgi:hypothetical protein